MDDAEAIWNRALESWAEDVEPELPGDRALANALAFHSEVQSGGLDHALDAVGELARAAADAFRHLGADDVAGIVERARELVERTADEDGEVDVARLEEEDAEEFDELGERWPDDEDVERFFRAHLEAHPEEFAPAGDAA